MLVPTVRTLALVALGCLVGLVAYWTMQQVLLIPTVLLFAVPIVGLLSLIPAMRSRDANVVVPEGLREGHSGDIQVRVPDSFADAQYRWKSLASGYSVAWVRLQGTRGRFSTGDLRRGEHVLTGVQARVTDVFGTWHWQPRLGGDHSILVGPETVPLEAALRSGFGATEVARLTGVTDQMDQLIRDHRREDGVRRIHWRASAKHGRLVVRKEEPPAAGRAVVVLDTTSGGYADDDEFDAAVRTFISFVALLRRAGTEISLVETSGGQLPRGAARLSDRELAHALATVQVHDGVPRLPKRTRVSTHLICGAHPSPEVASYIAQLGARDSVWGAASDIVERGGAKAAPLVRVTDSVFSELFA